MIEKIKENKKIVIPILIIILVLILGVTYAWFVQRSEGSDNKINLTASTGLELNITSEANEINLENAIPIPDSEGLALTPYTFTLSNGSSTNVSYKVYLDDVEIEGERIPDSVIKYSLTKNGGIPTTGMITTTHQTENNQTVRVLDSGVISSKIGNTNTTNTYTLRLWIDYDATTAISGKEFKGRIRVEGVQTEDAAVNSHIKKVYRYNENGTGSGTAYTGCLGGTEAGCSEVANITNSTSYNKGDIVKYEVADGVEKYFNVLYDKGDKLVMQQRENTVYSTAWYAGSNDNTKGPTTILPALENATSSWTNVNNQTYTAGSTIFGTGSFATANTACTWTQGATPNTSLCSSKTYPDFTKTNVKARMITAQEAGDMGCKMYKSGGSSDMSCKKFMDNYLYQSPTYGGTIADDYHTATDHNYGYWTASSNLSNSTSILYVGRIGYVSYGNTSDQSFGARAVVEINK